MKKAMCLLVVIVLLVTIGGGCKGVDDLGFADNGQTEPSANNAEHQDPAYYIGISNLAELEEMRKMISCEDEKELSSYMLHIEGGGAQSRDDLIEFVNIVDALPVMEFIDGEVTWIAYFSDAKTGTGVAFVTVKAESGEWTRMEYRLSAKDPLLEMEEMQKSGDLEQSSVISTVQNSDGRIKVYSEKIAGHPSGVGETLDWTIIADNVLVRVTYYTQNAKEVEIGELLENVRVTSIAKLG